MIVGTAGHVDHGKTSLIKRLTGVDTDRLEEEKSRGITIDLGFAYMAGADGETIGFVDVPGHERFVRTMVAGAAGIDLAILVIAADEGVMPQTREHLAILDMLGIRGGLVVVSKCDRVGVARRADVARAIADLVAGGFLSDAPLLFVSSKTGEGIDLLRDHLVDAARERRQRDGRGSFRMSVDRVFSLKGIGTIATGTTLDGTVEVDDVVTLFPGSLEARVRSLHAQNRAAGLAAAGQRCALALQGAGIARDAIERGSWICADPSSVETSRFDADVRLLSGEVLADGGSPIHFHCAASHCCGRVVALEGDSPQAGASRLGRLTIDSAMPLRHGDRFVLRDQGAQRTIGGGTVLDTQPPRRERRGPHLARLAALRPRDEGEALRQLVDLEPGFVDLSAFARQRGLRVEDLAAPRDAPDLVTLKVGPSIVGCREDRKAAIEAVVVASLAACHADDPDLPGETIERLRQAAAPMLAKPLFAALCDAMLAARTIARDGHWLRLPGFRPAVSQDKERLFRALRPLIEACPFQPPRVRDIGAALAVEEAAVRRACKTYARLGVLVEIGRDRFFLRETVVEMVAVARALTGQGEAFHASAFRDRLGNGRKMAIEILDAFDRRGLTSRKGEWRRTNDRRGALDDFDPVPG